MKIAWTSDLHLNFVNDKALNQFLESIRCAEFDALLVGGDIGQEDSFGNYLVRMAEAIRRPIYFVLGNHDCYGGTIGSARRLADNLSQNHPQIWYLPSCDPVRLSASTGLIGHGGWGDAQLGDFWNSQVRLTDFQRIGELLAAAHNRGLLLDLLTALGRDAGRFLGSQLRQALFEYDRVIVLTHVPPFAEASWHRGKPSGEDWLPFFACASTGIALRKVMEEYPDKRTTVLCGHTHSPGHCEVLPNLFVRTASAEYGDPGIQEIISLPSDETL